MKKVSNWWYLLPVIFTIAGGIIAWAVNTKHDPKKAKNFLWVGIIFSVLYVVVIMGVLTYFTTTSLDYAKGEAEITRAKTTMNLIWVIADEEQEAEGGYENFDCSYYYMIEPCEAIELHIGEVPVFNTSKEKYCAYIEIGKNSYYCIDSSLSRYKTDIFPGEAGYCSEDTYTCPPEASAN